MKITRFIIALAAAALAMVCLVGPRVTRDVDAQAPYRILVTNDDGVRAPGILAVAQALGAIGNVTIIAPADNQSGKSHSLALGDPIYADTVQLADGWAATALTATPAGCVKVALAELLPQKPDLVVSGINRGYNSGMLSYVSGTVGAAREAALQGIPAIAVSLNAAGHPNYAVAAEFTARIAQIVRTRTLERGVFLNVNVPAGPRDAIKGMRLTAQSAMAFAQRYEERKTPGGRRYFWNIPQNPGAAVEGTDVWATAEGYVAVTPLRVGEFDQKTFSAWQTAVQ